MLDKKNLKPWICTIGFWVSTLVSVAGSTFDQKFIAKAKKSVVTIQIDTLLAAYQSPGKSSGTGAIIDRKQGYILTNQHLIGPATIAHYKVIFHDGTQTEAKVLYYDPWLDYGILKVDPSQLPKDAMAIRLSNQPPQRNQPILIIGNNEQQGFSVHTGVVADLYAFTGAMAQQALQVSLNTKGGSSGSPIFNQRGEVIALNYARNQTFGFGLYIQYIAHGLSYLREGKIPPRRHIGALFGDCTLADLVLYKECDQEMQKAYHKQFPTALGRAIQVITTLPNTPAAGSLKPGDLIWAVNGKKIGPNLMDLDLEMNQVPPGQIYYLPFTEMVGLLT